MDKSHSYDSCSTGDSYGLDTLSRLADFDINHHGHLHPHHHSLTMDHHQTSRSFAKYRLGGDAAGGGESSRYYNSDTGTWPNIYGSGSRDHGSRHYGVGPCSKTSGTAADDHYYHDASKGKYRGQQTPAGRQVGDQFDYAGTGKKAAKPELVGIMNGVLDGLPPGVSQRGVRLGSAWTYWHITAEGGTEEDWKAGMKPMCTFDYKEQFWGMWNSIKPPSELGSKRELALFRGGLGRRPVWPDWNDSENVDGGRWKVIFRVTELPQIVDNFWRDLMVHCIEERWVPYSGFVNGVSITVKGQFYRIYIWLCLSKPANVEFIQDRAKELLKDIPYVQMDYVTGNGERPPQRGGGPLMIEQQAVALPAGSEDGTTVMKATDCWCCPISRTTKQKSCDGLERFEDKLCRASSGGINFL